MIVAGFFLAILCGYLFYRNQTLSIRCAVAEAKVKNQEELATSFRLISQETFTQTADSLVGIARTKFEEKEKAIGTMMGKLESQMGLLERERKMDHGALQQQLTSLLQAEHQLTSETSKLVKALRSPAGRGRWGELQLRRVVELAGMLNHCDFFEQSHIVIDGQKRKPDLIVKLPGERQVIIDAKVPLESYLDGVEASEESLKLEKLRAHSRHVRNHIVQLGKKSYWECNTQTAEFVVLFLPSEAIFAAAMETDPTLMEYAMAQGVILATPMTLIALLRAVAYGWKQETLSRHASQVSQLGYELYKRISDLSTHWGHLGKTLAQAVNGYNQATNTLEKQVLSSARKFTELGAGSILTPIQEIDFLESTPRAFPEEILGGKTLSQNHTKSVT